MKTQLIKTEGKCMQGLPLCTNLRAGKISFNSLGDFVQVFMSNSLTPDNFPRLQEGLDKTNEQCKQAGGGAKCDTWARNFGLRVVNG